jgi:prepilin signal peptidase PulO-like enzyme (type II secretory pathway)
MIPAETVSVQGRKLVRTEPVAFSKMLPAALALLKKNRPAAQVVAALSGTPQKGRVLASALKARGLDAGEIKALKRAGLKYLRVRESMPYAPLLAAGFLLAAFVEVTWRFGPK